MSSFRKASKPRTFRNAIENLEGRQLMTSITGTDVKILEASDKTKDNGNDVVVKFDKNMKTVDRSKIRMFGYSNNTLRGGQVKTTINITSARVSGSTLVLRTDVQVRKGAQLQIFPGGATDSANDAVTGTVKTAKGLNRDRFTLALRAFTPTDKSFFSSAVISGGATPITANTEPSSVSVRAALSTLLDRKVATGTITAAQKTSTLARYDSTEVRNKVPTANIRAAILSLVGTVGEPAIAYYLDGKNDTGKDFSTINIGTGFNGALPVAETKYTATGRLKFNLNPNYAGESFVVLSGRMAQEALQEGIESYPGMSEDGQVNSQDEEVVSYFVETVVYAQQTSLLFDYARTRTTLVLQNNYRLLALLNSGDRQFPRIGLNKAPLTNNDGVLPGMTPYFDDTPNTKILSFDEDVREEFKERGITDKEVPTQTFATGRAILKNLTGNTYPSTQKFDKNLIANIDLTQDTMSDRFAMTAARVIQVSVS